jgi:hypothetical protein
VADELFDVVLLVLDAEQDLLALDDDLVVLHVFVGDQLLVLLLQVVVVLKQFEQDLFVINGQWLPLDLMLGVDLALQFLHDEVLDDLLLDNLLLHQ